MIKISGKITRLKTTRRTQQFIKTRRRKEAADFLEFYLDDKKVEGWVASNPFVEGDRVNVAATKEGSLYTAYGIARPADRTVAVYPHCWLGRRARLSKLLLWWPLICVVGVSALVILLLWFSAYNGNKEVWNYFWLVEGVAFAVANLSFFSACRDYSPALLRAEEIFRALELPEPSKIDLKHSSQGQRNAKDTPAFGKGYFRY